MLRRVWLASAVSLSALAAPAPSAPPVVAIAPPTAAQGLDGLALLVAARASELIELGGGVSEIHLKQVVHALDDAGPGAPLESVRALVGADRLVAFAVKPGALDISVYTGGKAPARSSVALPEGWPAALDQGGVAVARAALGRAPPARADAQPRSETPSALEALARCYATVLRQPLSVDTPALLDADELDDAARRCAAALEADPRLTYAAATLALVDAIKGADREATRALTGLGDGEEVLEPFTLARFWLLTRYQSNEAGAAYLDGVVRRHPGELMARAYLGDTLHALGRHAEAEATWRAYLTRVPRSPWAMGRLSRSLARQGKHEEAVALARKAVALAPASNDARLELGSRLIDVGQAARAVTELEPLYRVASPRGEHVLRLGWAVWLTGDVERAATLFEKALALATSPGEWRTRGRAQYDLALVEMKRGRRDAARVSLRAASQTGFRIRELDPSLVEVARELEREGTGLDAGGARRLVPREVSLFPLDAYGEPDPKAAKPPPPEGLILFRFK